MFQLYTFFSLDLMSSIMLLGLMQMVVFSFFLSNIWYHLIIILMILEMFMLLIFFIMNLYLYLNKLSMFFVFSFITLSVAEASIGLSLLTMLVRTHGNDYMSINIF